MHITITTPDDWHVHFRDELLLLDTVPATAKHFSRALVMPNLKPALTTVDSLLSYRQRILAALEKGQNFTPFMTLYLSETIEPSALQRLKNYPFILGAKLYPAGATTNSEEGARSLRSLYPIFEVMQEQNLVLQIHGETIEGDIFYRESQFINESLRLLISDFPRLRIVLEHISTEDAVHFILEAPEQVAATITAHHLLYNRNQLLSGGIRPHYYCLPILKRETDQIALQKAAMSGNPKFFAGTDSAPHPQHSKESACGCAGIYSAPYAVAIYAQLFDKQGRLERLNNFMSCFGAQFYQVSENQTELNLVKKSQKIPETLTLGKDKVIPVAAGETLEWSVYEPS